MKLLILLALFVFNSSLTFSQDTSCNNLKMETTAELLAAESCIVLLANSILDSDITQSKLTTEMGTIFLWMSKTDKYMFSVNENITKLSKGGNNNIFPVYLACLTKAALEGHKDFQTKGLDYLYAYISKASNGVNITSKVKKFNADIAAKKYSKYF